jgi:thiamine biosynthesis lipoprotein
MGATELTTAFRSMASDVELRVVDPGPGAQAALERASTAIRAVATHLTRFDETSALSRANRDPGAWHVVPAELAEAVREAEAAHLATGGLFDPRVLATLLAWGYDRTFDAVADADGAWSLVWDQAGLTPSPVPGTSGPVAPGPWQPSVLSGARASLVNLGGTPIDLGGIGKGLAVRRAAAELVGAGASVLVDAGGDEWLGGHGPDGDGWKVGVEDPHGGDDPILVLVVSDLGCATSSVRRRRWRADGTPVHHLVDPRTARPGGPGLAAVTVLHPDPVWAEVWSKTLFLAGALEVEAQAQVRGLAAAWVTTDGDVRVSAAMAPHVMWRVAR